MASIEFPLSFIRQYTGPLDASTVFSSLTDLNVYIANNPIAYAGQVVSVSAGSDAGVYTIADNTGIKLATSNTAVQNISGVAGIQRLTQNQYNNLPAPGPDVDTLYVIVG